MNFLQPAQAGAQLLSLIVFGTIAIWYVAPWLRTLGRAEALTVLLWIHVFRYVALQAVSAQKAGFPISDGGLMEIVVGDVAGAVIAFATIAALRYWVRLAIPLAWLLAAETIVDTFLNIRGGIHESLMGAASGVTWLILGFYVPLLVVSLTLIVWQLFARRGQAIDSVARTSIARRLSI
ncbi:hypothetical protein DBIPINDM_006261 [Mesorhizobium sp. AR02]|uniref:hypothetical protein n=1 Tax=Mesorhizobium sp. AR02 TaxID=2865837 RepID=UPI002160007A|nr:hypothetical protein [Mesorhizobium sp. AR02]UVK52828.1 hypothetical protein DBIPINDM_006261 [Mesorhizobium sp. AR02]